MHPGSRSQIEAQELLKETAQNFMAMIDHSRDLLSFLGQPDIAIAFLPDQVSFSSGF